MCETFDINSKFIKSEQMSIISKIKEKLKTNSDNPKLKIEKITLKDSKKDFYVVQDGYLICGTKQRVSKLFIKNILKNNDKIDTLLYAGTSNGFGAIASAYTAYKLGFKSQVFLSGPVNEKNSRQINTLLALDSKITLCPTFKEARKKQYSISDAPKKNGSGWSVLPNFYNVPMGLNDENGVMTTLLSKQIKKASKNTIINDVKDLRIWVVGGSGGIAQSILKAFPHCKLHILLTGGGQYREEVIRWSKTVPNSVILIKKDQSLENSNAKNIGNYYSSVKNYDDLIWPYLKKYGKSGDFIWNVSSDDYLYL
jgi:hypothetical protein